MASLFRNSLGHRFLTALLLLGALCGWANLAHAQFTYSEDFKNSTAAGWVLNPAGNSTPNVTLTSGAAVRSGDPESSTIDPSGSGWLRLTNNTLNTHNAVYFDTPIPSAGNSVNIQFGVNLWGGNNFNNTGADGLTFFLYDASKTFQVGADGGSMGYAQKTGVNGLNGGFVAVALDAYGNFSVAAEGRVGGTVGLQANSIAVRGPGQGTNDYSYLAGTGNRDYTDTGSPSTLDAGDGTVPALPYNMAFGTATARPNQSTQYRNVSITINENSQLLVGMQFGEDGLWYNLLNVDLSSFVRPEQLKMGFSAGTGSGTIITEVGGLLQIEATAGSGNFVWDNRRGPSDSGVGNSVWGTGANDPLNWAGQTNPTLKSNVIFNSTYVGSAQNIDVTGSDKVVTNLYFSGANGYTLDTTEARKLIFDSVTVGGLTAINLTNEVAGNTSHVLALDLQMNRNLDINNNIAPAFTISGAIDTGTNSLGLKGTGTTLLSGAVSGAGDLTKTDSGVARLTGADDNTYTGVTTINAGTLQIEKASALGSTAAGTLINSGGTLALAGTGTTFAAESLTLNGAGVSNNGALYNAAGNNTWTGNIALASDSLVGAAGGTVLDITGGISGTNALTKVGTGTILLSGANNYTGVTNILAGALGISSESNLGSNPLVANAAQLNLDGGTLLTHSSGVTIDDANRGVTIGTAGGTFQTDTNLTLANVLTGSGLVTKTGSGTLTLSATNTHTGDLAINASTLIAQNGSAIGNTSAVTIAPGATLSTAGFSETVGSIAGAGSVALGNTGTTTFTTGANNQSTTFSGDISGGANNTFAKSGTGTLTLTGPSSLTGNVAVTGGGLTLNAAGGALSSAANITVAATSTLTLGAENQINNNANLILAGGTFVTAGFDATLRQLSQTSASTIDYLNDGSVLRFNGVTGSISGLGTLSGTLSIANWAGSINGSGGEQFVVYSTSGAPTVTNISFSDWGAATTVARNDLGAGFYEIVPLISGTYWDVNGNGNWNSASWASSATASGLTIASGINTVAILGDTISSVSPTVFSPLSVDPTITMNANRVVGKLVFENSANRNYTITPGATNRLDFNVTDGQQAQIIVNDNGAHTIGTSGQVNDPLLITNNSNAAVGLNITGSLQLQTLNQTLTVNGSGVTRIGGNITQTGITGSLLKAGTGTLILAGNNTYTGQTTLRGGTLQIDANAPSGASGALGTATSTVVVNDASTSATTNTALLIGTAGVTVGRNISVGSQGATTTLGGSHGTGNSTYSGSVTLNKSVELIAAGSSNVTFSGALLDGTGATNITKTGTGTIVLSNTGNTFDGATSIQQGTLRLGAANVLPNATAVTVASGATFDLAGLGETIGSLAGAGNVNLGSPGAVTTLVVGGDNTSTIFSGTMSGGANYGVQKTGTGTLTLGGNNSYAGLTAIAAGSVTIQHANALGNSGAASTTTVAASTALILDLIGSNTITNENLSLGGTLRSQAGDNTWSGGVALTGPSTLRTDSGTLTLSGASITGTGFGLVVAGAGNTTLSSSLNTGAAGTLTKNDSGTLILAASGNYTGASQLNAGTVEIRNATSLGTNAGSTVVAADATLALGGSSFGTAENLVINGGGAGGGGAIRNIASDHTLTGSLNLATESSVGVAAGTTLSISAGITSTGNSGLTKLDTGRLVLSGANTYGGTTAIAAGTLEITGTGTLGTTAIPTTIASGATLAFNTLSASSGENITVTGTGVSGAGAIQSIAGTNTLTGNVSMTGSSAIGVTAGSFTIGGNVTGAYDLLKTGGGNLALSGSANAYTGTTTVRNGTLTVTTNAPVSANGALGNSGSTVQIGDVGTAAGDSLAFVIGGATGGVTVDRTISVNNFNASGSTALGGSNTSGTNTFAGNIGLGRNTNLVSSTGGTVAFNGALSGAGGITASGTGTVVLSGSNSLDGSATIASGATLIAANSNALGTTAAGTTVNSGGTLGVQGNIALPAGESFTLGGSGASSAGALRNVSGDNSIGGPVTLSADTTIASTAGTLTLNGALAESGGSRNLTTTGAGNLVLTAASSLTGSVIIGGTGTTTLANTSGQTFGSVGNVTVGTGAILALGAANQINDNANLILAGGTFNVGAFSETMRQLSQTSASAIDYLNDGSILRFNGVTGSVAGLGPLTGTLSINNWAGSLDGGGTEQLVVYSNAGAPNVGSVTFTDWGTATTIDRSGDLSAGYYEIVPLISGTYWDVNGSGTWGNSSWANGATASGIAGPNVASAIAILGDTISSVSPTVFSPLTVNPTITLGAAVTIGKLVFENSANRSYTIDGANRLDFNVGSGQAQIIVNDNGSHSISTTVASRINDTLLITNNSDAAVGLAINTGLQLRATGVDVIVNGTGTTRIDGAITLSGGFTGNDLLKTGSGTLVLSGANAYTGTTTMRGGTLVIEANAPSGAAGTLGNATTAIIVNDASTTATMTSQLLIGAPNVSLNRTITVGAQGAGTTLGGNHTTGNSTFAGSVSLNRSINLTAAGTSNVTFSGTLLDGTGTTNITKVGTGTVILSNAGNTYDGPTAINEGTLRLGVAAAVPNNSAVSVAGGATFDLNGFSETIGSLAGAGNVTGSTNAITLTTGGNNASTTFSGIISDAAGTLALTKTGTGTMTLSGANSYDGTTSVTAGTLIAAHNTALGSSTGATTVAADATLGLQGAALTITGETLTLNTASSAPANASLANLSGINTWTGNVTLAGGASNAVKIDAAGGSQLTLSGNIFETGGAKVLSKTGTGTVILSGTNTHTGSTNVAAGTLIVASNGALGTTLAGTSVQIGATLGVQGNVTIAAGETYTLNGQIAPPSAPSIKNISDNNTLAGDIAISGGVNTGVAIDSNTGTLTLSGAIADGPNANYLVKTGSGTVALTGSASNTFSGGFTINDGLVTAAKSAGDATGDAGVNVGDGVGGAATAVLRLDAANQINNGSTVTIATDGQLNVQSFNDSIGALTLGGGSVVGSGTVNLGNNLTFNGVGSSTAAIAANVDLGTSNLSSGSRIVQVGNNGLNNDSDLTISGSISGAAGFVKTDLGTLQLSGTTANANSGTFQIADGTVTLNKTAGLNATGTGNILVGDGAGAANTANLKLLASNQIANGSRVTVYGDGKFDVNGLTETIGSFAGIGRIDTGVNGTLIAGGDNTSSTFGGTLAGTGMIQKVGAGDLTFSANMSYGGELRLSGGEITLAGINLAVGTLRITGNTVLDFGLSAASTLTATNVIIDPGATLTITNWVHLQDYFYATGSFQQFGGPTAIFDARNVIPQNQIVFSGWNASDTTWQSWDRQITPAPEPATYGALMATGALALFGYRNWRKRRPSQAQTSSRG